MFQEPPTASNHAGQDESDKLPEDPDLVHLVSSATVHGLDALLATVEADVASELDRIGAGHPLGQPFQVEEPRTVAAF
eukprot:5919926-Amphidinium_carterae.1